MDSEANNQTDDVNISVGSPSVNGNLANSKNSNNNNSPNNNNNNGVRKTRWRPTQEQKQVLESLWNENPYPDSKTKEQITKRLGTSVTYRQVTSWFKHRREVIQTNNQSNHKIIR